MYDARLVRAAQEGDEAAFAALYDRAIDSVYDLCWWLTGDAEESARLVEEAFVLAAQNLGELTDPSQVRPWLLAIAADRALSDDAEGVLKSGWPAAGGRPVTDEPLGTVALREWTAQSAAILALPDQIVLELQLRQQLEGDQLAATIGSTPAGLPALLARVDEEADTVLSALVLARQGRKDCPDLAGLLAGWDGLPTVEIADLADKHARGCRRCTQRRALISPLELVAEAPVIAGPATLRTPILEAVAGELAAMAALPRRRDPAPEPGPAVDAPPGCDPARSASTMTTVMPITRADPGSRRAVPVGALVGVAAVLLVLIGVVALALRSGGGKPASTIASPTTLAAVGGGPAPTLAPIDTTTTPTTALPVSVLGLNTSRVELGTAATSAQVVLSNTSTTPANWAASPSAKWLTVTPSSGSLGANQSSRITLSVDRTAAPQGPFDARVTFTGSDAGSRSATADVVGTNGPPPTTSTSSTTVVTSLTLGSVSANPTTVYTSPCAFQPTMSTVTATITDPGGSPTVELRYTLPGRSVAHEPMTEGSNGQWSATLPSSSTTGTITYTVLASDHGSSAKSSGEVTVTACTGVH